MLALKTSSPQKHDFTVPNTFAVCQGSYNWPSGPRRLVYARHSSGGEQTHLLRSKGTGGPGNRMQMRPRPSSPRGKSASAAVRQPQNDKVFKFTHLARVSGGARAWLHASRLSSCRTQFRRYGGFLWLLSGSGSAKGIEEAGVRCSG